MTVPDPHVGDNALAFAARERAAILEANRRLGNDGAFYLDVQTRFGAN